MPDPLEDIARPARNFDSPPLHLWHPQLSGDIPIRITADGSWYHDGDKITRESLVRLFASILRREDDGEYYLVSPHEKWRIEVELLPLIVTDLELQEEGELPHWQALLNTGKRVTIGPEHPLLLEPAAGNIPAIKLDHGLSALLSRAAWYRVVAEAQERDGVPVLVSGAHCYPLAAPADDPPGQ